MKKFNFPVIFKLIPPFSIIFSLSFIYFASAFNSHYDADIDLSFVSKLAYTLEDTAKSSAAKLSADIENAKNTLNSHISALYEKDKVDSAENITNTLSSDTESPENIYDFTLNGDFAYLSQHDPKWSFVSFGAGDSIDIQGCGPTSLAMIVSNLTDKSLTPDQGARLMFEQNLYLPGIGSSHAIIPEGLRSFGIKASGFSNYSKTAITKELEKGNMFAVLMKNGIFSSSSGHFIIIVGLDDSGKAIIADSNSVANSKKTWDLDVIIDEAKYSANSGGPLWLIDSSSAN